MAQHDYVIANGTGAAVRSDLNNALAAIVSNNSGSTEPATTYAFQFWADTTANLLKMRNAANSAWITLRELDGTLTIEDGTAAAPGLAFADDLNTGLFSGGADELGLSTNGTARLTISTTAITAALPVDAPLGAVGTPSYTFTGDLNTGMWSPAADTVAVSTGGSERLRISSDGSLSAVIPGGSTLYPASTCRAWVNFNGTGTVAIRSSYNVSSITDNGTGLYTVNLTTAMPDTNYAPIGSSLNTGVNYTFLSCQPTTTSAIELATFQSNSTSTIVDSAVVSIAVFR